MKKYDGSKYDPIPISTWGTQRMVTLDLLKNQVSNEDYLYNQVDLLWDQTPPMTRKYFSPVALDQNKSYGVELANDNSYHVYGKTSTELRIRFLDEPSGEDNDSYYVHNMIDTVKTTAVLQGDVITIPKETVSVLDKNTRDYSPFNGENDMTCNEFWYIGYDKNRVYETRPNWIMNEEHGGIPSVCRAQTFKVDFKDKTRTTGVLESVVLNLRGEQLQTGVPLIVEITEAVEYNGTYYPATRDQINNSRYSTSQYGDGRRAKQIAKQYWYPTNTNPGVVSITFDWGAVVEEGKHYAIVLRSPLNHQPNPYAVGGWNKHCDPDVYKNGDAFMSNNNGYTWIKYGKPDKVSYHQGMYAPQDFAFQCNIRQYNTQYKTGSFEIYTKPLHYEGISEIELSAVDESRDGHIEYYAYNNGNWYKFDQFNQVQFKDKTDITIIKAVLSLPSSGTLAPYISTLRLNINHDYFTNAVLRTMPYTPRTTGILGASAYSHVHCPYTVADPQNDSVTVDVVKETVQYEHMNIIHITDLPLYGSLCDMVTATVREEIETITRTEDTERKQKLITTFLSNHADLIIDMKTNHNVYILEDPTFTNFYLGHEAAYPILRCTLQPIDDMTEEFTEWLDYTVDYDQNIIQFPSSLRFSPGTLTIEYNPLFAKNIPDDDTFSKGINLSLLHHYKDITDNDLESEIVTLNLLCEPLNPIRETTIIRDNEIIALVEGKDYDVDYNGKLVKIKATQLKVGDKIDVAYTPYLIDDSISLCYHIKRSNGDDVSIQGNYIDYNT